MGLTTIEALQDHPQAAFVREGETIATYTDAPGPDPLLTRAKAAPVDPEPAKEPEGAAEAEASTDATVAAEEPAAPDPDEIPQSVLDAEARQAAQVKCEACPRTFDPSAEAHWPYADGGFRCSECGAREPVE